MGLQFQRLYYKKDRIPEKYNELEAIKYVSRQRLKVLAAPNKLLHHTLIHVVLIVTGGWRGGYNNYLMILYWPANSKQLSEYNKLDNRLVLFGTITNSKSFLSQ